MSRGESNVDSYSIFAEEYGVDAYEGLVRRNPDLKERTVDYISSRAVVAAMEGLSPLEAAGLDKVQAGRVLAAVMFERALLPLAEVIYHDDDASSRMSGISREDEQVERDLAERIYHASKDPRIFDYTSSGEDKDVLISQLQLDYDLTEEQARGIVADVKYRAGEIVDYDDEA